MPMELGYQYLGYKSINVVSAQFLYRYDTRNGVFKILNDATKYTVAELSWKLLEEHNLYEFRMVDRKCVTIFEDPATGEQSISEVRVGSKQAVTLRFDIGRTGELLGMPNQDDVVARVSANMGLNVTHIEGEQQDKIFNYIEKGISTFWNGLFEDWIEFKECRNDPAKEEAVKQRAGMTVETKLH